MEGYIYGTGYGPGISETRHWYEGVAMLMFAMSTPVNAELTRTRMAFTWNGDNIKQPPLPSISITTPSVRLKERTPPVLSPLT